MKDQKLIVTLLLLGCIAMIQSCSNQDIEAEKRSIHAQNAKYMEAYNGKDARGVAELHADDVFVMPPNFSIVKGKDAVETAIDEEINAGGQNLVFTTIEMNVEGNYAYEVGRYTMTVDPDGKSAVSDTGKYVVVWEKQQNGEWLMKADIWNSDLPKQG